MVCARCGFTNATNAQTCSSCGMPLGSLRTGGYAPGGAAPQAPSERPPLAEANPAPVTTSWLPKQDRKPPISAAASGLVPPHHARSIWQLQTTGSPTATPPPPRAQAAAALTLPGAVMGSIYAVYQLVWRRGIFATIASDPIGVNDYAARRSDDLNSVLLVAAVVLVTGSAVGAVWWIRRTRLFAAFRGAAVVFGVGLLLCLVAAIVSQSDSATRIAVAYVLGGLGCAGLAGALAFVFGRAVQAVVGHTSWARHAHTAATPNADALAGLRTAQPSTADLARSGLVTPEPERASHDWSALKGNK